MDFKEAKQVYKRLKKMRPLLLLRNDSIINAYSNLFYIEITQGALDAYNKDEMALCLGHELGHIFNFDIIRKKGHKIEYAADAYGVELARKAGFDVLAGCERFKKIRQKETESHPHPKKRKEAIIKTLEP